jgi:3-hydroxyisobutyrate dehydrogenase-like beta-hydroxyacid dehydrogenase
MQIRNVGVVSPGDMGQAVAARLKEAGFLVHTSLAGRSERTRALAAQAGLLDAGSIESLVSKCDLVWSILNPAAAVDKAREVADAMKKTGRKIGYVECNAIAPQSVREIDGIIRAAGGFVIDAGLIGAPPRGKNRTRLYVSGPEAGLLSQVNHEHLQIRIAGERVGDASAVKMCYAAITKGAVALGVELWMAAHKLGIEDVLEKEFKASQPEIQEWVLSRCTTMPPKAYRWVPEMLEIAKTFDGVGMTPRILEGAAEMYERIAGTPLGQESPEAARERGRSGWEIVQALAASGPDAPK